MTTLRIAFLTPEYAGAKRDSGGLGSYLLRMTRALASLGCEVEVFTRGDEAVVRVEEGVRITICPPAETLPLKLLSAHWRGRVAFGGTLLQLRAARGIARAFEQRDAESGFDLVQTSDWGLTGFFARAGAHRRLVQRCSWSRALCREASGQPVTLDFRLLTRLDGLCLKRADLAYAPSRFVADQLARQYSAKVQVLRPPAPEGGTRENRDSPQHAAGRPYLLHFGLMSPLKGTDVVVRAFDIARRREPGLRVLLVGREHQAGYVESLTGALDAPAGGIRWVGPVARERMAELVRGALAAVLPSRADNLPNTVIESLSSGTPVVGTDGASIDELVEHEKTGLLVPMGDVDALADAMVAAWRHPWRVGAEQLALHPTWRAMRPEVAARNLLNLAGIEERAARRAA